MRTEMRRFSTFSMSGGAYDDKDFMIIRNRSNRALNLMYRSLESNISLQ